MHPHFLAIPLPSSIRSRLASFCYGLPKIRWVEEENFHLTLRYLGPLSSSLLEDIQERLQALYFPPFSLNLQGVGHFHSRGNRGVLWVGVADNPILSNLKKEIDHCLKGLSLPPDDRTFHPHLTLGRYEHLSHERLSEYLMAHMDYQSEAIEVTSCLLLRTQQTPKHVFYEVVNQYAASPPNTGED